MCLAVDHNYEFIVGNASVSVEDSIDAVVADQWTQVNFVEVKNASFFEEALFVELVHEGTFGLLVNKDCIKITFWVNIVQSVIKLQLFGFRNGRVIWTVILKQKSKVFQFIIFNLVLRQLAKDVWLFFIAKVSSGV